MKEINNLSLKDAALKYLEKGFPIVPRCPKSKKFLFLKPKPGSIDNPLTKKEDVLKVWDEIPDANISIKTDDLLIVDIDQHEKSNGVKKAEKAGFPKTLAQYTPNMGLHLIFKNPENRKIKIADSGIDYISGDYCLMMAPSIVDGKKYAFANNRKIIDFKYTLIPEQKPAPVNGDKIPDVLLDGERNIHLTRLAGVYAAKGMEYKQVFASVWGENVLRCDPPLDKQEIDGIVNSICNSENLKTQTLKDRIEDFINDGPGPFTIDMLDRELGIRQDEKNNRKQILKRLTDAGKIERGTRRGYYRVCDYESQTMDFINIKDNIGISIPFPLGLSQYTRMAPKNIVIIAGASNAGKSAWALNIIHNILNFKAVKMSDYTGQQVTRNAMMATDYLLCNRFALEYKKIPGTNLDELIMEQINGERKPVPVLYLNSESSAEELNLRMREFPGGVKSFARPNFQAIERESNFQDILEPNGVNVIDYLSIPDNFWLVGAEIKKIFDKLEKGIAIICIQKSDEKELGRGGSFTKDAARLVISLDNNYPYGHTCKVIKNKLAAPGQPKQLGLSHDFLLGGGAIIKPIGDWNYIKNKSDRTGINKLYQESGIHEDNPVNGTEQKIKCVADLM